MTLRKTAIVSLLALVASTQLFAGIFMKGDGKVTESIRKVHGFTAIDVSGVANVTVSKGKDFFVSVETDSNLQSVFETKVKGEVLTLGFKDGTSVSKLTKLAVKITMPELIGVEVSGTSNIKLADAFSGDVFEADISGSGEFSGTLNYKKVNLDGSGSGGFDLKGSSDSIKITISGSANVDAKQFSSRKANIDISGVGSVNVGVTESLDASISGAGSVVYYGDPKHVNRDVSGVGSIRKGS